MEELEKYNLSPQAIRKIKELSEYTNDFKIIATVSEGPGNPEMGEVGYLVEQREVFFVPIEQEKVIYKLHISKVLKDSSKEELKPNPSEDLYQENLKPIFSRTFYSKESLLSFLELLDLASLSSFSYYWFVEAQKIQL